MPLVKPLGGIASARQMPQFAPKTFRQMWASRQAARPAAGSHRKKVVLWPDTFNNHFLPQTAMAAAEVLENAGYEVVLPKKRLCCGRPLYDWGFLGMAKKLLGQTMNGLRDELNQGLPIIGLEPSCVSVFRDELLNLFPRHEVARKLSESVLTLSEFIQREGDAFIVPEVRRKAVVQAHCHHKGVMRFDSEEHVLQRIGLDYEHPDSGCCGMAGAFGFQKEHYDISMKVGERVILPLVRETDPDTLIIADGFSCREQIVQGTGRKSLHLAEVMRLGIG